MKHKNLIVTALIAFSLGVAAGIGFMLLPKSETSRGYSVQSGSFSSFTKPELTVPQCDAKEDCIKSEKK